MNARAANSPLANPAAGADELPRMRDATLLDYFAANAIAGITANPNSGCNTPTDLAHWAYEVADACMLQRQRRINTR